MHLCLPGLPEASVARKACCSACAGPLLLSAAGFSLVLGAAPADPSCTEATSVQLASAMKPPEGAWAAEQQHRQRPHGPCSRQRQLQGYIGVPTQTLNHNMTVLVTLTRTQPSESSCLNALLWLLLIPMLRASSSCCAQHATKGRCSRDAAAGTAAASTVVCSFKLRGTLLLLLLLKVAAVGSALTCRLLLLPNAARAWLPPASLTTVVTVSESSCCWSCCEPHEDSADWLAAGCCCCSSCSSSSRLLAKYVC